MTAINWIESWKGGDVTLPFIVIVFIIVMFLFKSSKKKEAKPEATVSEKEQLIRQLLK